MLYRYPLPQPSYIRCFAYDYDRDISDSDDDDDTSTPRNTTFETKPMQEMELASPDQSIERDLTKVRKVHIHCMPLSLTICSLSDYQQPRVVSHACPSS